MVSMYIVLCHDDFGISIYDILRKSCWYQKLNENHLVLVWTFTSFGFGVLVLGEYFVDAVAFGNFFNSMVSSSIDNSYVCPIFSAFSLKSSFDNHS